MSRPDKIIYIVNARIPNGRAHGIQISKTSQALSKKIDSFRLVTPFSWAARNLRSVELSDAHIKLPAFDLPIFPGINFYLRLCTFGASLYFYLIFEYLKATFTNKKVAIYIRGEIAFFIVPFCKLFPLYFETHQIRNHKKAYSWLLKRMDGVVVITDCLKNKFINDFGIDSNRIAVARDGVDLDFFNSFDKNKTEDIYLKLPKDKKLVIYSGSLSVEKGVDTLAKAAAYLPDEFQVVFVGGIGDQVDLFKKAYGHLSNISILGKVDHSKIPALLQSASILVLPDSSKYQYSNLYTSPMKLFEYMASGVPIVASNIPSLREVLAEDTAFFFEADDSHDLAKTIKSCYLSKDEALIKASVARRKVGEFTWNKRAEIILKLINLG